mgnify:CR=1 FL=1
MKIKHNFKNLKVWKKSVDLAVNVAWYSTHAVGIIDGARLCIAILWQQNQGRHPRIRRNRNESVKVSIKAQVQFLVSLNVL